jgi:putative transcriptional regulator
MNICKGSIIISTPLLQESVFEEVVVLITEKNEQGAIGFIVNKEFPKKLNDLVAYSNSLPFSLYNGGPVATESLFFIHNCPNLIQGGTAINDTLFVGGNFNQAVQHINQKNITDNHIQLFIGYCGWDANELEAEIEEGSWLVYNKAIQNNFFSHQFNWGTIFTAVNTNNR